MSLEPGTIQTRSIGGTAAKVQYRCSRGHVFEDISPESEAPTANIIEIDKPEKARGRYCAICFQEMVGRVAPVGEPLEENKGPIAAMSEKIAWLEGVVIGLDSRTVGLLQI